MVYLAIKELAPLAQDVIMVTSSVTKDMNARGDLIYKPNAIRALVTITDVISLSFYLSIIYIMK